VAKTHQETRMYPDTQLFIDGTWRAARGGRSLPVLNPATEEVIGQVAHASTDDLDEALEAAARGFATWKKVSAFDRSKLMRKAADIFRSRADAIAHMMTLEQGKPAAPMAASFRPAPRVCTSWL
jgi:succinate-semialdehyde dehydrogenase/glutarate-semialdehyde dehydrogenase